MHQGIRSMPILAASNLEESVSFYTQGLGFGLAGVQKDEAGQGSFAIVQLDGITLGLKASKGHDPLAGWTAYLYLADISAFIDQIQGNAVQLKSGPKDSFYHCTEVEIEDPSGNILCFAQDLRPGVDGPGL